VKRKVVEVVTRNSTSRQISI
jgi:hypothetical protein